MAKFRIGIWEEVSGYVTVEAKTEAQARKKAEQILDNDGVSGFSDFDAKHRGTNILECERE